MAAPDFPRCRAGDTLQTACAGLADDLVALGFDLPSVYLLAGERLRWRPGLRVRGSSCRGCRQRRSCTWAPRAAR